MSTPTEEASDLKVVGTSEDVARRVRSALSLLLSSTSISGLATGGFALTASYPPDYLITVTVEVGPIPFHMKKDWDKSRT
jgi:hypothetical protein